MPPACTLARTFVPIALVASTTLLVIGTVRAATASPPVAVTIAVTDDMSSPAGAALLRGCNDAAARVNALRTAPLRRANVTCVAVDDGGGDEPSAASRLTAAMVPYANTSLFGIVTTRTTVAASGSPMVQAATDLHTTLFVASLVDSTNATPASNVVSLLGSTNLQALILSRWAQRGGAIRTWDPSQLFQSVICVVDAAAPSPSPGMTIAASVIASMFQFCQFAAVRGPSIVPNNAAIFTVGAANLSSLVDALRAQVPSPAATAAIVATTSPARLVAIATALAAIGLARIAALPGVAACATPIMPSTAVANFSIVTTWLPLDDETEPLGLAAGTALAYDLGVVAVSVVTTALRQMATNGTVAAASTVVGPLISQRGDFVAFNRNGSSTALSPVTIALAHSCRASFPKWLDVVSIAVPTNNGVSTNPSPPSSLASARIDMLRLIPPESAAAGNALSDSILVSIGDAAVGNCSDRYGRMAAMARQGAVAVSATMPPTTPPFAVSVVVVAPVSSPTSLPTASLPLGIQTLNNAAFEAAIAKTPVFARDRVASPTAVGYAPYLFRSQNWGGDARGAIIIVPIDAVATMDANALCATAFGKFQQQRDAVVILTDDATAQQSSTTNIPPLSLDVFAAVDALSKPCTVSANAPATVSVTVATAPATLEAYLDGMLQVLAQWHSNSQLLLVVPPAASDIAVNAVESWQLTPNPLYVVVDDDSANATVNGGIEGRQDSFILCLDSLRCNADFVTSLPFRNVIFPAAPWADQIAASVINASMGVTVYVLQLGTPGSSTAAYVDAFHTSATLWERIIRIFAPSSVANIGSGFAFPASDAMFGSPVLAPLMAASSPDLRKCASSSTGATYWQPKQSWAALVDVAARGVAWRVYNRTVTCAGVSLATQTTAPAAPLRYSLVLIAALCVLVLCFSFIRFSRVRRGMRAAAEERKRKQLEIANIRGAAADFGGGGGVSPSGSASLQQHHSDSARSAASRASSISAISASSVDLGGGGLLRDTVEGLLSATQLSRRRESTLISLLSLSAADLAMMSAEYEEPERDGTTAPPDAIMSGSPSASPLPPLSFSVKESTASKTKAARTRMQTPGLSALALGAYVVPLVLILMTEGRNIVVFGQLASDAATTADSQNAAVDLFRCATTHGIERASLIASQIKRQAGAQSWNPITDSSFVTRSLWAKRQFAALVDVSACDDAYQSIGPDGVDAPAIAIETITARDTADSIYYAALGSAALRERYSLIFESVAASCPDTTIGRKISTLSRVLSLLSSALDVSVFVGLGSSFNVDATLATAPKNATPIRYSTVVAPAGVAPWHAAVDFKAYLTIIQSQSPAMANFSFLALHDVIADDVVGAMLDVLGTLSPAPTAAAVDAAMLRSMNVTSFATTRLQSIGIDDVTWLIQRTMEQWDATFDDVYRAHVLQPSSSMFFTSQRNQTIAETTLFLFFFLFVVLVIRSAILTIIGLRFNRRIAVASHQTIMGALFVPGTLIKNYVGAGALSQLQAGRPLFQTTVVRTVCCLVANLRDFSLMAAVDRKGGEFDWLRSIVAPLVDTIEANRGVVSDFYGDTLVAFFETATQGVEAAVGLQVETAKINLEAEAVNVTRAERTTTLHGTRNLDEARGGVARPHQQQHRPTEIPQPTDGNDFEMIENADDAAAILNIGLHYDAMRFGCLDCAGHTVVGAYCEGVRITRMLQRACVAVGSAFLATRFTLEQSHLELLHRRIGQVRATDLSEAVDVVDIFHREEMRVKLYKRRTKALVESAIDHINGGNEDAARELLASCQQLATQAQLCDALVERKLTSMNLVEDV